MASLQTASITEPKVISEVIHFDLGDYSRDTAIIASGNNLFVIGEVLGIITVSGKYAKYNNAASDGTEIAAAIALQPGDATAADVTGVAIEKRIATVLKTGLVFDPGQNQAAQDAAIVDLEAAGFKIATPI